MLRSYSYWKGLYVTVDCSNVADLWSKQNEKMNGTSLPLFVSVVSLFACLPLCINVPSNHIKTHACSIKWEFQRPDRWCWIWDVEGCSPSKANYKFSSSSKPLWLFPLAHFSHTLMNLLQRHSSTVVNIGGVGEGRAMAWADIQKESL